MDPTRRRELLHIARQAIRDELTGRPPSVAESTIGAEGIGGAFVTLRREGQLRGCMGTFAPAEDVARCVAEIARLACHDPRFVRHPITPAELDDLSIEISLLSRPEPLPDPSRLRIGEHGILIRRGNRGGCFLPQVAVEHGWTAEEFIERCCTLKADLPPAAWKDPDTLVMFFSAEVFSEEPTSGGRD